MGASKLPVLLGEAFQIVECPKSILIESYNSDRWLTIMSRPGFVADETIDGRQLDSQRVSRPLLA